MKTQLYSFWRSSAAFRVRIALNLKGMDYDVIPVHLVKKGGEQSTPEYTGKNPNGLVPVLTDGEHHIHQSLAIIEYLEEIKPEPALLPASPIDRAWVRSLAMDIAMDVHPLGNLRVLRYLVRNLGISAEAKDDWSRHWITLGLESLEKLLGEDPRVGRFICGDQPGLADLCLVPQLFNAFSAKIDTEPYPTLLRIYQECMTIPAFMNASWEQQIDAEGLNPIAPPKKQ